MTRPWKAAAVALSLLSAGTAQATIVSGAFSGTIAGNTFDTYGLFGAAGATLSGLTLQASYSYDTAATSYYAVLSDQDAYGGTGGLTLSVSIDGTTVATSGVPDTEIIDAQDGADTMVTLANLSPTPLIDFTLFSQGAWVSGVTIDAPFTVDTTYYQQAIYVSGDGSHYDVLHFVGESAPATPAPEPASLTLLASGLIAIGSLRAALRR